MGGGKVIRVGTANTEEIAYMSREMLVVVAAERDVLEADPLEAATRPLYLSEGEKVTFETTDLLVGTYVRESTETGCIEAAIRTPVSYYGPKTRECAV